jgi:hypothetical protein
MKTVNLIPGILLAALAVDAMAACPGTRLNKQQIESQLNNTSITAVAPNNEDWKEDHCSGGDLYKVGTTESPPKYPGGPSVDPRALRGTWAAENLGSNRGAAITYSYYADPAHSTAIGYISGPFRVYLDGTTLYFCTEADVEVAHTTARGALTGTCP